MSQIHLDENRKKVINFIQNHPSATYRQIRKELKIHPERIFQNGIKEAFKLARVKLPRTFERKNRCVRRTIVIDYIKKHPGAGSLEISHKTGINLNGSFKNIGEAYGLAGLVYPRTIKKKAMDRRKEIINLIKHNPQITIPEIMDQLMCNPYRFFNSTQEMYSAANLNRISGNEKRHSRKEKIVLDFIKENPLATQREINLACKTKIQELFEGGIKEAYSVAGVEFPFERSILHGVALKEIKNRAQAFEEEIALKLKGYGHVNRLVKTKRGFADIILERNGKKIIIEVKDYRAKEISISQIMQLNRYLEDCNCGLGVLICHKKPKKDTFLIGKNKIFVLEYSQLNEITTLI